MNAVAEDFLTPAERMALREEEADVLDDLRALADGEDESAAEVSHSAFDPTFLSRIPVADPEALEAQIRQAEALRGQLEDAYETGESDLSHAEYRAKMRDIDARLMTLSEERAEARMIGRFQQQALRDDWQRQIDVVRQEARALGLDLKPGSEQEAQWDRCVKFLGSDPDNTDKDGWWFLQEALRMVAARHGAGDGAEAGHRSAVAREHDGRSPNLDRLSGLALERALARLSPEEADAWLES